jgi:hypothetical protein
MPTTAAAWSIVQAKGIPEIPSPKASASRGMGMTGQHAEIDVERICLGNFEGTIEDRADRTPLVPPIKGRTFLNFVEGAMTHIYKFRQTLWSFVPSGFYFNMTSNASAQPESNQKAPRPALSHNDREGCIPATLESVRSLERNLEEANADLSNGAKNSRVKQRTRFCAESWAKRTEYKVSCNKREEGDGDLSESVLCL